MHTGSQQFFNSFLFSRDVARDESASPPPRSTSIQFSPLVEDKAENGYPLELDTEQQTSAALQAQDELDHIDDLGSPREQQAMMSSISRDPVSVSPAAMFLSAFSPAAAAPSPLPDAEGHVISGYTFGNIIGHGGFSTIRRAFSTSGGVVAVKIVRHSDLFKHGNAALARKRIKCEAAVWSTLSHEHILPLFSAVHTAYADYFFTLFCPAGSLFDILKRDGRPALPQDDVGMMFRQVVRGLRYLHEVALFVHRDIKLENVLVDEMGVCRIGDFGMTRKIGELDEEEDELTQVQNQDTPQAGNSTVQRAASLAVPSVKRQPRSALKAQLSVARHSGPRHRNSTSSAQTAHTAHVFQPGSLPYAAPELLLPQTSNPLCPHPAQDIWALGILLYGLLMGRLPFADPFEPRLQMKILNGVYEVPPDIGRGAERVLKGCLDRSITARWTIEMVDDVAWGIGWGAEGDDVTPAESDEESETCLPRRPLASLSRSRSRHADTALPQNQSPQWRHDEPTRPSLEAASRRSSSRIKRSLSRAPVLTDRSSSGRNMMGRSMSRHSRPPSPTFSALNSSILSNSTMSESSSCSSALLISPHTSLERGRKLQKYRGFRSPSPTIAHTNTSDMRSRFSAPVEALEDQPDDLEREASRGRRKYGRGVRPLYSDQLYSAGGEIASELDVLDETADWTAPNTASSNRSSSIDAHSLSRIATTPRHNIGGCGNDRSQSRPCDRAEPLVQKKRPGSTPPAPVSFWPLASRNGPRSFSTVDQMPKLPGDNVLSSPKPAESIARSRSLGLYPRANDLYLRLP